MPALPLGLKQTHGLLSTSASAPLFRSWSGPHKLGVVSKLRVAAAHEDVRSDAPHNKVRPRYGSPFFGEAAPLFVYFKELLGTVAETTKLIYVE